MLCLEKCNKRTVFCYIIAIHQNWNGYKISIFKNAVNIDSGVQAHEAANTLVKNGFRDVLVLQGGIFNIGWTAANERLSSLAKLKTDVPVENQ